MSRILVDSGIEWIGKIPCDWNLLQLRNATLEINEKNNPIKFSNILSLTNTLGVVPYEEKGNQGNISKEDVSQYKLAYKNTIIINSMNLKIGSVGLSAYDGCVSPVYYVLAGKTETDIRFINYIFQSDFQKYLGKYGKGILEIREKIPMYDVLHAYIPYPTRMEQIRIANYLDSKCSMIDKTIEDNNKAIKLLEELKNNTILDYVLGNKYRNRKKTSIEWIKDIPETWNVTNIGLNCFVTKLAGFEYTNYFDGNITSNGDVPIVRAQNIKMGIFKDDIEEYISMNISLKLSRCALDKRCVLITFIGAGIGEVALFEKNERYHLAPNVAKIVVNPDKKNTIDEKYLMYYLMSNAGQEEINQIKKATAQPSLSMETIRNIKIVVPDTLDEQLEIVSHLDKMCFNIDRVIKYRKQIIEKLEEYKKSIIYEVVTGKKEV